MIAAQYRARIAAASLRFRALAAARRGALGAAALDGARCRAGLRRAAPGSSARLRPRPVGDPRRDRERQSRRSRRAPRIRAARHHATCRLPRLRPGSCWSIRPTACASATSSELEALYAELGAQAAARASRLAGRRVHRQSPSRARARPACATRTHTFYNGAHRVPVAALRARLRGAARADRASRRAARLEAARAGPVPRCSPTACARISRGSRAGRDART